MQRFTTVLKSLNDRMDEQPSSVISTRPIYMKGQQVKSSHECSSSPLTNSDSSSDTNNQTVTLTTANSSFTNNNNNSSRYISRPTGRQFFKSKSAAVSRSASNSRMAAEKIYINHNSSDEDQLSTSETDDLNSDDDSKLVYRTCLESPSPTPRVYLKKSLSRPECALQNFNFNAPDPKMESNRRFVKNHNRLKSSKSMSQYKNVQSFQSNEEDDDEEDEENSYYRQLDGPMKSGRMRRFKVIKSKSNSALHPVRNNFNGRKYDSPYENQNDDDKPKGTQKDDQITNQLQLNELAERLKFIERKLMENELNTEKKLKNISQNINPIYPINSQFSPTIVSHSNHHTQINNHRYQATQINPQKKPQNQDDLYLNNGKFHARIYPSISFGDCSEINLQPKNEKNKRHFFSSAKSAVKNSRSIPSLFIPNKDKSEKSSVEKLPGSDSLKKSSSKIWKTPFNILSNLVDDKLRGRWHSSKSMKSSSIRSNSICSASNVSSKRLDNLQNKSDKQFIYGPIFNRKDDSKSSGNKFINNLSNLSSRKNSQNNPSNASSQNDLARSATGSSNSSRFSSTRHLIETQQLIAGSQKARAHSTPNEKLLVSPNEEIFNLLSLPFMDEDEYEKTNELDRFDSKVAKQSKSYKEIGSQALKEIEEFEKLLAQKFINNKLK